MPWELDPIINPPAPSGSKFETSKWSVVVPPIGYPVTWADVKKQLRIDADTEQAHFETFIIPGATEFVEQQLATSLMPRTLLATFYDGQRLELPRGPIIEVVSLLDANDVTSTTFEVSHAGHAARVLLVSGSLTYPISVTYRAGYAAAADIPADIRLMLLMEIATRHRHRESETEKPRTAPPHSVESWYRRRSRSAGIG